MVNAALPMLLMVKVCALLGVFSGWLGKVSTLANKLIPALLAVPLPSKTTARGLLGALEAMLIVADSLAMAEGVKVTAIEQLPPATRVAGETGQLLV